MKKKNAVKKRLLALPFITGGFLLALPTLAFASEEVAEDGGILSKLGPLLPNLGEFIPMAIGFLILLFVLGKFAWPVITGMLDKRVNTIKESLEKSEAARIESERLLEEYKAQLDEAKKQAAQIVADAKLAGENARAEINQQAKEQAEGIIARATANIEAEKKAAIAQLQGSVADLSVSVAGRLIGNDLSDKEHRKIIERYLMEAGNFDAN